MQCEMCRDRLLQEPERVMVGRKLTEEQRQRLLKITAEDFENSAALAGAVGMDVSELIEGINHPRARLRHL
jgi:hypothetical protein